MRYTVVWTRLAESRLASIYNTTPQPSAVASAANRIDQVLMQDPLRFARSVGKQVWVLECLPIVVLFTVSDDDRLVRVLNVREVGQQP